MQFTKFDAPLGLLNLEFLKQFFFQKIMDMGFVMKQTCTKFSRQFFFLLIFRYPVVLNQFAINKGSGGKGKFRGGDGVIRELLFRKEQILSVLTERRVLQPYGLKGNTV